jgi:26S proteasome regulatory subunit N10
MNKSQRQRIIIFVGHPVNEDLSECENLGKRLKRNNVGIDVINFAHPDNVPKLQALVQCANNSDNSHFMDVPMGVAMITDVLITSPILQGENADVQMAGDGGPANIADPVANRFAEYGGYNPDMDPEMANAMKISMEEYRAN